MPQKITLTIELKDLSKHKHVHIVETLDFIMNELQAKKYSYSRLEAVQSGEIEVTYSENISV